MSTNTIVETEITVYLAEEGRFEPFTPDSRLRPIYGYRRQVDVVDPRPVLEQAFFMFNHHGLEMETEADRFTAEGYASTGARSLSVGDVVVVGETAWAVERFGWKIVDLTRDQIIDPD